MIFLVRMGLVSAVVGRDTVLDSLLWYSNVPNSLADAMAALAAKYGEPDQIVHEV